MKRTALVMLGLCLPVGTAWAEKACPLERVLNFCVAGGADAKKLASIAEQDGWKLEWPPTASSQSYPRASFFHVVTPEGFQFAVQYQEYKRFASAMCHLDYEATLAQIGLWKACSVDEFDGFDASLRNQLQGQVSRRDSDGGISYMIEDERQWTRVVVVNTGDGGPTNAWVEMHALKE